MRNVRTRFAPSPTGFMHIGNLRTALYSFLIAKNLNGKFILRIEDTDQKRKVEGSVDLIFKTLEKAGIKYDEGPDIGGDFGPYVQSQRQNKYLPFAKKLIENGDAYYCFCESCEKESFEGYDRKCRNLSKDKIKNFLEKNTLYAIRQKMPIFGNTTFNDTVFGEITIENKELEDQILIKRDGFPTYNFANVVDDHEMQITHVVRGNEYLISTPKYNLLYKAFGWESPIYVHTGLILGQNEDGTTSKLSKRHGSISFEDLVNEGYIPEVIVNYVALLGWSPRDTREFFTIDELIEAFSIENINKSPSIFDFDKLNWFNSEYLKAKSNKRFVEICEDQLKKVFDKNFNLYQEENIDILAHMLKPRVVVLNQIPDMLYFLKELPKYDLSFFENKKSKSDKKTSLKMLEKFLKELLKINNWCFDNVKSTIIDLAKKLEVKNGTLMWPIRISVSGVMVTPGGAPEILTLLGKDESVLRIKKGINLLKSGG